MEIIAQGEEMVKMLIVAGLLLTAVTLAVITILDSI